MQERLERVHGSVFSPAIPTDKRPHPLGCVMFEYVRKTFNRRTVVQSALSSFKSSRGDKLCSALWKRQTFILFPQSDGKFQSTACNVFSNLVSLSLSSPATMKL